MDDSGNALNQAEFVYVNADIFELEVDMIVNPVNCKGVSGAGLALEFKKRFPVSQKRYEAVCKQEMFMTDATGTRKKVAAFRPGDILHFIDIDLNSPILQDYANKKAESDGLEDSGTEKLEKLLSQRKHLIYFPTKNHWKRPARYEYISKGMLALRDLLLKPDVNVESIAIPALGCGLGGLSPSVVSGIIIDHLKDLPLKVYMLHPLVEL